jgi:uncharacterized protein YcsI (UPF0317 family)
MKVMKRQSTLNRIELLKQLNLLERKNKFRKQWDNKVKIAFRVTGSFSFEEMIIKDEVVARDLVEQFK